MSNSRRSKRNIDNKHDSIVAFAFHLSFIIYFRVIIFGVGHEFSVSPARQDSCVEL